MFHLIIFNIQHNLYFPAHTHKIYRDVKTHTHTHTHTHRWRWRAAYTIRTSQAVTTQSARLRPPPPLTTFFIGRHIYLFMRGRGSFQRKNQQTSLQKTRRYPLLSSSVLDRNQLIRLPRFEFPNPGSRSATTARTPCTYPG